MSYDGLYCTNVVRYDSYDWVPLGTGVNSNVNAIAVLDNNVYVGGSFTKAGGLNVSRVAMWDGANWSRMGGGVTNSRSFTVYSLALAGNDVYAGGSFTNAAGLPANRIAKWDGANWSALGSGVVYPGISSGSVVGLAAFGSDLYVGGTFQLAGNKPSYYLGRWNETRDFDAGPTLSLSRARKTPTGPFQFTITASGMPGYVVEVTTNFFTWTHLLTNTAGSFDFSDGAAGHPGRFYRVHSLP
jgi:hypothetical protein